MTGFLITFVFMFLVFYLNKDKILIDNYIYCFAFLILFVWGGLRFSCNDYETYENFYNAIENWGLTSGMEENDHMEQGWAIINQIIPSFRLVILCQTALICFSYAMVMKKYIQPYYSFLFILLIFLSGDKSLMFMFSAMRNSIPICIGLLNIPLILNRKWIIAIILSVLASTVHTSAMVFLSVEVIIGFFLMDTYMSKTEFRIWLVVMLLLVVLPIDRIVELISGLMSDSSLERYSHLVDAGQERSKILATFGSCLMSYGLLYYLHHHAMNAEELLIGRIGLLFSYSYLLGTLNARISQYYLVYFLISVIFILSNQSVNRIKYFYLAFVIAFLGYSLFNVELKSEYSHFLTFKSIF